MGLNLNKKAVAGVVVLAAGALGGGAYAATTTDNGASSRQAFLNDAASRAGVSPQRLKDALAGALQDRLNAEVKAGRLTQAEANKIVQRFEQGDGLGPLPFGGRAQVKPFGIRGGPLGSAASYLGLSVPQLLDQLRGGKSLAQVASAQHKSTSGLENAIVSDERTRLDKARAAGRITAQQEQQELGELQSRVKDLVNHTGGLRTFHRSGRLPAPPNGPPPGVPGPAPGGFGPPPPPSSLS